MSIKLPSSSHYLNKVTVARGLMEHVANRQSIGKPATRCAAPESLNSIPDGSSHGCISKEHGVDKTSADSSLNQSEKKFRIKSSCKSVANSRDAAPRRYFLWVLQTKGLQKQQNGDRQDQQDQI